MCVVLYVLCLYVCFDICIRDTPTFTASCTVVSTTCVCVCVCIEMEKKKKKKKKKRQKTYHKTKPYKQTNETIPYGYTASANADSRQKNRVSCMHVGMRVNT